MSTTTIEPRRRRGAAHRRPAVRAPWGAIGLALVAVATAATGALLGASSYRILYASDLQPKYLVVVAIVAVLLIAAVLKNVRENPNPVK